MKPKLTRLAAWLVVATMWPVTSCTQEFVLETNANGVIIIGYVGSGGPVVIPETINDLPVIGIAECAFCDTPITSLFIPRTVTNISAGAVAYCAELLEIVVAPDNPAYCSVDGMLFDKAQRTLIQFPGGKSGSDAFPDSMARIGSWAFGGCSQLVKFTIPETVTSIEDYGFEGCGSLVSILITANVTNIGYCAFAGCFGLTNVVISNSPACIGPWAFFICTGLRSIVIPGSVWKVGDMAFGGCDNLADVLICDGVLSIGEFVFSGCRLTNCTLPASVTNIGDAPFNSCYWLRDIWVDPNNAFYTSSEGVLFDKAKSRLIQYPPSKKDPTYVVPATVTEIGNYAFERSLYLTNITLPACLTNIGNYAFAHCRLSSIQIPCGVAVIGDGAFFGCSIRDAMLPGTLRRIGRYAFAYTGLTLVSIPASLTDIGDYAFSGCANLVSVAIPTGVSEIKEGTFASCIGLTNVILHGELTSIGPRAFAVCRRLSSISIPSKVTQIGQSAFFGCSGLTHVFIPRSVTNIGSRAFADCRSLGAITVDPLNPAYAGVDGVLFNKNLTALLQVPGGKTGNYVMPHSVTNVGEAAFMGCSGLTNITVAAGVSAIGDAAFENCANLEGVYFRGPTPVLCGSSVFYRADKATVYYLPRAAGWDTTFGGRPTEIWKPKILTCDPNFGLQSNRFGFTIEWASGQIVVVEACTNASDPIWWQLTTNVLPDDLLYFGDAEWANHALRFYRIWAP